MRLGWLSRDCAVNSVVVSVVSGKQPSGLIAEQVKLVLVCTARDMQLKGLVSAGLPVKQCPCIQHKCYWSGCVL